MTEPKRIPEQVEWTAVVTVKMPAIRYEEGWHADDIKAWIQHAVESGTPETEHPDPEGAVVSVRLRDYREGDGR